MYTRTIPAYALKACVCWLSLTSTVCTCEFDSHIHVHTHDTSTCIETLILFTVKEPACVADWVSKALALEKLLAIRDKEVRTK